jgi:hypothetical protein
MIKCRTNNVTMSQSYHRDRFRLEGLVYKVCVTIWGLPTCDQVSQ